MILQLLPFWILSGVISAYFAYRRGRNPRIWFFLGLLLGIFGFLTLFLLPSQRKEASEEIVETVTDPVRPRNTSFDRPWFYVNIHHEQRGPIYFNELLIAWQQGDFNKDSLIWCEGMASWKKMEDYPELLRELTT